MNNNHNAMGLIKEILEMQIAVKILFNYSESWGHISNTCETFFHWKFLNTINLGRENPKY